MIDKAQMSSMMILLMDIFKNGISIFFIEAEEKKMLNSSRLLLKQLLMARIAES